MATMDVFNSNAFSMVSLTAALEKVPYQPQMLGAMNIFEPVPIRTTTAMVEERDGVLSLIQTSQRGAPLGERTTENRKVRNFSTHRIAKSDTIYAHEVQNIRAFGSETEFMQVQAEVARRFAGPTGLLRDVEMTWENMRLGCIQGTVLDADGSTLYDWPTEFGISLDTEIDFDLDAASPASGAVRKKCAQVVRQMGRQAKGAWTPQTQVWGVCDDAFWDDLIAHSEVRQTYLNWEAAASLRGNAAWTEPMYYGGIYWVNYRGTDDNSTVAVGADKVKFFPVGAPGVFQVYYSPAETFDFANTLGRDVYGMTVPDRDRNAFVKVEAYSYPLFICTRPKMLQRGRRT